MTDHKILVDNGGRVMDGINKHNDLQAYHKWLTEEVLQECWHKPDIRVAETLYLKCNKCYRVFEVGTEPNRTFTEWADYGAVVERMPEDMYIAFSNWVFRNAVMSFVSVFKSWKTFFQTLFEWWQKEIKAQS